MPRLPTCSVGAPPGPPPGASRPAPRLGGITGLAVPPELRRRLPGTTRSLPGAAEASERIRLALLQAQPKLLAAKQKLEASIASTRHQLASRS